MFNVLESVPIGTFIGVIQSNDSTVIIEPPILIVPFGDNGQNVDGTQPNNRDSGSSSGSSSDSGSIYSSNSCNVDTELNIDQSTGEIRSAVELDRERCSRYSFIALSLTGLNIHVDIVSFLSFFSSIFFTFLISSNKTSRKHPRILEIEDS